ncbi:helix-turn-helix transcriptional regulator [Actinomadura xylanilytica]|uniref:helix-turn-helix transcriptional regulator n=1 Tax=Actinomadura xylanilytica TaxID=887459 RepID=UPI00255AF023|nr:helix-turn-helix transcriptional regulator [Actinomadura xylanilytica]MDL4777488.1 helix-turn-helix transcriptional regulator [Actinomadura xylanilytica]
MNKEELGGFLRSRRARVQPAEMGLAAGARRQTPGLRREEVALLAGISVDYYIRLEQGRGPHPSEQVLGALGRVLRLTADEHDHLLRLAGHPPVRAVPTREVPGNVLRLLERLDGVPAMVINVRYDVLAWNPLLVALIGDPAERPAGERNTLRWLFGGDRPPSGSMLQLGRQCVADLRASGRYPGDPDVRRLVDELSASSPQFAALWAAREIAVQRTLRKRTVHPVVGELELDCEILPVPGRDQRLVLYTAAPGTASGHALRRLRDTLPG